MRGEWGRRRKRLSKISFTRGDKNIFLKVGDKIWEGDCFRKGRAGLYSLRLRSPGWDFVCLSAKYIVHNLYV